MDKEDVVLTVEYYSAIKKERNLAICNDVDATRMYYVKRNKSVRERQIPYDFTHVEFKKQNRRTYGGGKKKERGKQTITDS